MQFEATLEKEPRRFRSLYGAAHAAQLSGSRDLSQKYFGELLAVCARSDNPGRPEIQEASAALAKEQELIGLLRSGRSWRSTTGLSAGNCDIDSTRC